MTWSLRFSSGVEKDMCSIDRTEARFILESLEQYASDFNERYEAELMKSGRAKALSGDWEGYYRLRLRSYRAIYKKYNETLVILVVRVSHRKDVYR
ncbi:MAG: type II toxin-antitoxin system mRNA interferase toxin, RelE/StbE family [Spirochaetae bacterium HGW-Spirochaetae-9]|nr:MAG: type II toxin-antitoxin system mRNA interferase toxin, RelE/StbE family [Spirochaetae bacterium HGW-Spirochaetae-9]